MDPYSVLGLNPGASLDQIQEAYQLKRAEIISVDENDPESSAKLILLDQAYHQLIEPAKSDLALLNQMPASQPPNQANNPALAMVDRLDSPIMASADNVAYQACLHCGSPNPSQSLICSACGQQIARPCPNCGKIVMLSLPVCPRCNTVIREHDKVRLMEGKHVQQQIQNERVVDHVRVTALETAHKKRAEFGCVLWAAVIFGTIFVCGMGAYAAFYFGYLAQR